MKVVWDDAKRLMNLDTHGLDFSDARDRLVFEDAMLLPGHAGDDGRPRFIAIGPLDGRLVTIVFSPLGSEALSLISLRPTSRKERKAYETR
jgi:uncharacterized DUF497 family protein